MILSLEKAYISRHVLYNETCFPFSNIFSTPSLSSSPFSILGLSFRLHYLLTHSLHHHHHHHYHLQFQLQFLPHLLFLIILIHSISIDLPILPTPPLVSPPTLHAALVLSPSVPVLSTTVPAVLVVSNFFAAATLPPVVAPHSSLNSHSMTTRSKAKRLVCFQASSFDLATKLLHTKPAIIKEALQSCVWVTAMQEEFKALQSQGTWDLVHLLSSKLAIGCKWVLRIKKNSDGSIARYKARLVAKG